MAECIDGEANVKESASEDLRSARGAMSLIQNKLKGLLRTHPGEVSEQVGDVSKVCWVADNACSVWYEGGWVWGVNVQPSMCTHSPGAACVCVRTHA